MKNILLLLIISFGFIYPQKSLIREATFKGDIRNFSYASNILFTTTYEFGVRSTVYKSTDLGQSWQSLPSNPFNPGDNLTAIYFFNETTGWVAGASGKMYKTTDGGQTWIDKSSILITSGISEIEFVTPSIGYICGSVTGTSGIAKTTDGGDTWDTLTTYSSSLNEMYWQNELTGWAAGNSKKIFKTTDGGLTWISLPVTGGATGALYRIIAVDANTFYALGIGGYVFKSTDGGNTFASVTRPTTFTLYTGAFFNSSNGLVAGTNGESYRTTDGGTTWIAIPSFSTEVLKASIIINSNVYIGGYKSTLFSSADQGLTWTKHADSQRDMYSVYVEDASTYLITGDRGEVNYTTDGGDTWKKTSFMTGNLLYDGYKNGSNIYISGQGGSYYYSTNLGNTWNFTLVGLTTTRNYNLNFLSETHGYIVNNEGKIYYTTNKGAEWTERASFPSTILYKIQMLNADTGYAVGSGSRIFKTEDGGLNWSHGMLAAPAEQLTGIHMLDADNGYVCGENGVVYKTTSGFRNVTMINDTIGKFGITMRDVFAFSPEFVYAVSSKGYIYKTSSADAMSVIDSSFSGEDLLSISRLNDNSFLVSGGDGSVYRIIDPAVPVEMISFTASADNDQVVLQWTTATELNNKGFEIERKVKGNIWKQIGFIQGKGTTTEIQNYSFTDIPESNEIYVYRLKQIDLDGKYSYSNEIEVNLIQVKEFSLNQNYPNPFNPSTIITYTIPEASVIKLTVFNSLGQEVKVLENGFKPAGIYKIEFKAEGSASGIYYYKIEAGSYSQVKKMTMLK
jgi:photosystem II stability/assembly factor-like uncharacterized protein